MRELIEKVRAGEDPREVGASSAQTLEESLLREHAMISRARLREAAIPKPPAAVRAEIMMRIDDGSESFNLGFTRSGELKDPRAAAEALVILAEMDDTITRRFAKSLMDYAYQLEVAVGSPGAVTRTFERMDMKWSPPT